MNIYIFAYSTMEIIFKKDYVAHLYEGHTKPYKEYKSNPSLVAQYVKTINKLKSITKIEQLYQIKSLNYEKKVGNLEGVSAVWINKQYRVLFVEVASKPGSVTIDLLEIEELSKHYQ